MIWEKVVPVYKVCIYVCLCVCVHSKNLWSNLENLKNNTKLDSLLNDFLSFFGEKFMIQNFDFWCFPAFFQLQY